MSSDKHGSDDEYQLPDDFMGEDDHDDHSNEDMDTFHDFSEGNEKTSSIVDFVTNNKKTVLVGGLLAAGLFSYVFLWDKSSTISTVNQPIVQKKTYDPHAKDIKSLKALGQSADVRLDRLENQLNQINNQFNVVNSRDSELKTVLSNSASEIQTLSSQIKQLLASQSQFSNEFSDFRKQQTLEIKRLLAKKKKKSAPIKPVVYYIQALEPGRAWLMNPKHVGTTIAVGDHLIDYGRIVKINVERGIIRTSSGRDIHYARGDH